mgnify:CR=1 FL=1
MTHRQVKALHEMENAERLVKSTIDALKHGDDDGTFFSSIIARVEKAKAIWEGGE